MVNQPNSDDCGSESFKDIKSLEDGIRQNRPKIRMDRYNKIKTNFVRTNNKMVL